MAHFAKLDKNNKVLEVHVVNNDVLDSDNEEQSGIEFLTEWSNGYTNWKQTSYNATFRKNYAGIGFIFDEELNAFIAPKPYTKWILNKETCQWESPMPYPTDGQNYEWNNKKGEWELNG
jgi:hypothetical protein